MNRNYLYIILAAVGWGITGIFISALDGYGLTTPIISAARSVFTALIIGLWLLIYNRSAFKIRLKDIWVFIGTGVLSFTFFTYCYYLSINYNGMAVAAVLLYTAPVFVSVMSALIFRSAFTKYKVIALILSFLGCALVSEVFNADYRISTMGILSGLGSGFGYALYTIFGEIAIKKGYKSETISFYTFVSASVATVTFALFGGIPEISDFGKISVILVLFALLTGAAPYLLYTKGLEKTEPSMAAIVATIEPVVAAILGVTVLNEGLTITKFFGILLIFISLLVANRQKEC